MSAPLDLMFNFLQQASQPGGKVLYSYVLEGVLGRVDEHFGCSTMQWFDSLNPYSELGKPTDSTRLLA